MSKGTVHVFCDDEGVGDFGGGTENNKHTRTHADTLTVPV